MHPDSVAIINSFIKSEIQVTVCTNGSLISDGFLKKIVDLSKVTFNVSLDAFSQKSFDLFRVNEMQSSFKKIISNIQLLSKLNILKGILVTPNIYVPIGKYILGSDPRKIKQIFSKKFINKNRSNKRPSFLKASYTFLAWVEHNELYINLLRYEKQNLCLNNIIRKRCRM